MVLDLERLSEILGPEFRQAVMPGWKKWDFFLQTSVLRQEQGRCDSTPHVARSLGSLVTAVCTGISYDQKNRGKRWEANSCIIS